MTDTKPPARAQRPAAAGDLAALRDLFRYNDWANARLLSVLRPLPPDVLTREFVSSFPSLRRTLAHMVMAEWIWLERWLGRSPAALPEWATDAELPVLEAALHDVQARRGAWLAGLDEAAPGRTLEYRNTAGRTFAFVLRDLLVHAVNHATFHRGQLVTLLRQAGVRELPGTDVFVWRREAGPPAPPAPAAPIRFVVGMTIKPGRRAEFEAVAREMAARTQAEPGALEYSFHVDADGTRCTLLEAYADGAAVVAHLTGPVVRELVPRATEHATLEGFEVLGEPGPEARALLAAFGARVLAGGPGFRR